MNKMRVLAGSLFLTGVLVVGLGAPAGAATTYSVTVTPKIVEGKRILGIPTGRSTNSVTFYSSANAQMKSVTTHAVVREYPSNELLYDTTKTTKASNINSLTWSVPSKYRSGYGFKASMTTTFKTKTGTTTKKSTSKQWVTPKI
ncbi:MULTISPECIES: hypothetical protein [Curtobacterium]|uniref:hypothetical protein n=1 Tax=Curtobacterium TaxID=2034 RepID=UPI00111376BD|nr:MULTISPECIES: hypothetical protein [Curtobacterium]MCS5519528.1 hypothetical protein [Curtobacterium flaccumfaciens]